MPKSFISDDIGLRRVLAFCHDWRTAREVSAFFNVSLPTACKWMAKLVEQHLAQGRVNRYQIIGRPSVQYRAYRDFRGTINENPHGIERSFKPVQDEPPMDLSFID